jgi:hypothetical protein
VIGEGGVDKCRAVAGGPLRSFGARDTRHMPQRGSFQAHARASFGSVDPSTNRQGALVSGCPQ